MAYTINLTNGSIFATIPDGTTNIDSSLILIGRNFNGYGEFVAENFIKLLENHASDILKRPINPLVGQVWFNTDENTLKVYDGTTFKNIGTASSQTTEPVTPVDGDLWFDTTTAQLKVFDGTDYALVGPLYTTGTGIAGPIVTTIDDTGSQPHVVTFLYSEDTIIGVISNDPTFTPLLPVPGFTDINPGIQLADNYNANFTGTATNSLDLGGEPASSYLRSDVADSTVGLLSILTDDGLRIGVDSDISINQIGDNAYIANTTIGGLLVLQATSNTGLKDVITMANDGPDVRARVSAPGTSGFDIANKGYVDSIIPPGTKMLFQQTTAPVGWTKDVVHNNKALRVVSGPVTTGGTVPFTTAFSSSPTGSHTLTAAQVPNHNHTATFTGVALPTHRHDSGIIFTGTAGGGNPFLSNAGFGGNLTSLVSAGTPSGSVTVNSTAGGGNSHNHSLALAVQYVDIIIASKD